MYKELVCGLCIIILILVGIGLGFIGEFIIAVVLLSAVCVWCVYLVVRETKKIPRPQ